MAKKILYKVTSYHCPRCGGVTEPTKKYCEYCERELQIKRYSGEKMNALRARIMIGCGNDYVFFNEISRFSGNSFETETIDVTCLEDTSRRYITGKKVDSTFQFSLPVTKRGMELYNLIDISKIYKVRIEMDFGTLDYAFESMGYIGNVDQTIGSNSIASQEVNMIFTDDMKRYDSMIPQEVMSELTCPNCGAPINNRLCACQYCGGWSQIDWS